MTRPNQHTKSNSSRIAGHDAEKTSDQLYKGSVQPSYDGRLKESREQGVHRGDEE